VWIVYPQKKHLSARVQAFIEWVRELFERTNEPQQQMSTHGRLEKAVRNLPMTA